MAKVRKQSPRKTVKEKTGLLSNVTEIDFEEEGLKMSLYGKSGTGKTTLYATYPKPLLAVVCGRRSGELRSIRNVKGIKAYALTESNDVFALCSELEESNEFKTVVLDHASHLQDMTLSEIIGVDQIPAQKSWGLASQQQYGQCSLKMKEFLRAFLQLSCNVVIVSQEREFNNDTDSDLLLPYVGSALSPSVTGWLNPAVDYLVQTFKKRITKTVKKKVGGKVLIQEVETNKTGYYLRTGPDPIYMTKFRMPREYKLPDAILDPTYTKIMEVIEGKYDASSDS